MTGAVLVVGVDPGPIPGVVALGRVADDRPTTPSVFQTDPHSVLWLVEKALGTSGPAVRRILAVERFVLGPRSSRLSTSRAAALTRDMVGALMLLGDELAGVTVVQRCAAEVMPWATDKRLAAVGLLEMTKGMQHARAAGRHALFAAVRDGRLPDPLSKVRTP